MQVDDIGNPWAFYAVAESSGNQIRNVHQPQDLAPRLMAEIPAMLARHPAVHRMPCRALYETHMAATRVAARGKAYPEANDALSLVLLRDEFLHIAWAGDAKIVLGRLASKASAPSKPAADPVTHPGTLRLASRHKSGAGRKEGYINSQQMKQFLQFDGPPPILRAVDLTAQTSEASGSLKIQQFNLSGSGVSAGDTAAGGYTEESCRSNVQADGCPDVRRMKLKPEDVCVVIATQGLWKCLTPEEVVTIVGQRLNCMASDAADALTAEVRRRLRPCHGSVEAENLAAIEEELTVVVIYLAGERYVKDYDRERANHLNGDFFASEGLLPPREARGFQWGCCKGGGSQQLPGGPEHDI